MALNIQFSGNIHDKDEVQYTGAEVKYQGYFRKENSGSSNSMWSDVRSSELGAFNINLGDGQWLQQTGTVNAGDKVILCFWVDNTKGRLDLDLSQWAAIEITHNGSDFYTQNVKLEDAFNPNCSFSRTGSNNVSENVIINDTGCNDEHTWTYASRTHFQGYQRYGQTIFEINHLPSTAIDVDWDDATQTSNQAPGTSYNHQYTYSGDFDITAYVTNHSGLQCTTSFLAQRIYWRAPVVNFSIDEINPYPMGNNGLGELVTFVNTTTDPDSQAAISTSGTGDLNSNILITSKPGSENNITVVLVGGGTAGSEGVSFASTTLTITIEDGVSTQQQIANAIKTDSHILNAVPDSASTVVTLGVGSDTVTIAGGTGSGRNWYWDWTLPDNGIYGNFDTAYNAVLRSYSPTHSWHNPGVFSINLEVNWWNGFTWQSGNISRSITQHVWVTPVTSFTLNNITPLPQDENGLGVTVIATNTSTDPNTRRTIDSWNFDWEFEDIGLYGNFTATNDGVLFAISPSHDFKNPGVHNINLVYNWNDGFQWREGTVSHSITQRVWEVVNGLTWDTPVIVNQPNIYTPAVTGSITHVKDIDYNIDSVPTYLNLTLNQTFTHTFLVSSPHTVRQIISYHDGFALKTQESNFAIVMKSLAAFISYEYGCGLRFESQSVAGTPPFTNYIWTISKAVKAIGDLNNMILINSEGGPDGNILLKIVAGGVLQSATGDLDGKILITANPGKVGNIKVELLPGGTAGAEDVIWDVATNTLSINIEDGVSTQQEICVAIASDDKIATAVPDNASTVWTLGVGTDEIMLSGGTNIVQAFYDEPTKTMTVTIEDAVSTQAQIAAALIEHQLIESAVADNPANVWIIGNNDTPAVGDLSSKILITSINGDKGNVVIELVSGGTAGSELVTDDEEAAQGVIDAKLTITAEIGDQGNIEVLLIAGGTAGTEVVTFNSTLNRLTIQIENGVSTQQQICNAIASSPLIASAVPASSGNTWTLGVGTDTTTLTGGKTLSVINVKIEDTISTQAQIATAIESHALIATAVPDTPAGVWTLGNGVDTVTLRGGSESDELRLTGGQITILATASSGQMTTYDYSWPYTGDYLVTLEVTDSAADNDSVTEKFDVVECPGTTETMAGGEIEIEPDRWQMLAIPIQFGYWDSVGHKHVHDGLTPAKIKNYLMDQIADIMGGPAQNYVTIANCYIGDEDQFRSYIPGFTNPLSTQNFPLGFQDGLRLEYTAFWIKSIHNVPIVIKWGDI